MIKFAHAKMLAPLLIASAACMGALASVTEISLLKPLPEHKETTRNIVSALASRHYVPTRLNDDLSARILDDYIDDLDPGKNYFLQEDIDEFMVYQHRLDNALRHGDLKPAFHIFNRYHSRVISRFEKVLDLLEKGIEQFDFTLDEDLLIDRELTAWAKSEAALDEIWRKRVKNAVLNLKLTSKEPEKIQELLVKRFTNRLMRSRQTNNEDVYQLYMNAFTRTYDPHTQYFSPRNSENFNINMSLSLEGIGAVLQLEDEYTKVVSIVPAGPADKAGVLKPDDKIVAVGQGEAGEMVDVIGWRLDEVVQKIRGPKGTVVRLDIIPAAEGEVGLRTISITRNKVELEEQSAKSEIIEIEQFGATHSIGVIRIPTFYVDFQAMQKGDENFKSTSRDVKNLVKDLVSKNVDGIVIDVRNNGGGGLHEAKAVTGLFIDRGPTVQVRSKSNQVNILEDRDSSVIYDGPLAILVNRLSASASEILSGAIQDYERGIIIGTRTFGKGTVQALLPLNRGQLKLTQAKFYRISGESTQSKGVIPDIHYPSTYDPESIGESTLESPLPWDKIATTRYQRDHTLNYLIPELRSRHAARVEENPEFNYLIDAFAWRKARNERTTISLNEKQRIQEKSERDDFWLKLENRKREALGQDALASLDDLEEEDETENPEVADSESTNSESANSEVTNREDQKPEEKEDVDAWLMESGHILLDMISLQERTASETQQLQGS